MSKTIAILISLISPLLLFIILPSLFITRLPDISSESFTKATSLTASNPSYFVFTPRHNNINQFDLELKNPNLSNQSLIYIDLTTSNYSYQTSLTGFNVGDPSWITLKIPPLSSANHPVAVKISSDNQVLDTLFVTTNDQGTPNFRTFYTPQSLFDNILHQLEIFTHRYPIYNLIFLFMLILLNYLYLRQK